MVETSLTRHRRANSLNTYLSQIPPRTGRSPLDELYRVFRRCYRPWAAGWSVANLALEIDILSSLAKNVDADVIVIWPGW
jgi:hypothetical protein